MISNYHIGVVSHKRPDNVKPMIDATNCDNLVWYVGKDEKNQYTEQGAYKVVEAGTLLQARNAVLKDAWKIGKTAVMIDDDLINISKMVIKEKKKKAERITFHEALETINNALIETRMKLGGVSPTHNPYFTHKPVQLKHFIIASLCMIKPCELYFDESFKLKEDYDYTLQHIQKYGGVARCDTILANFKHYDNKGGCVDYRNDSMEEKMVKQLKSKWGNAVKDNPRRQHEVLLNIK